MRLKPGSRHAHTADPFLLFEFSGGGAAFSPLVFYDPVQVLEAYEPPEVLPLLRSVEEASRRGLFAAGFLSYEAAPGLDPVLTVRPGGSLPLAWFGLFEGPRVADLSTDNPDCYRVSSWEPDLTTGEYRQAVEAIRAAIARGETYQLNFTFRLRARFEGDDFGFYRSLCKAQQGGYSAYLRLGRHRILSASPELFFHLRLDRIVVRPMKGTARRGRWPAEDDAAAAALAASEKNRAENVMIVDLLRNDLGRIARTGSVRTLSLHDVERYPTILQMTSTVEGEPGPGVGLPEIFAALFPSGSVTGAPKVRTMEIIARLEGTPRQVYTGAIGLLTPRGEALFNVAIRTALVDARERTATYGVGGGITWDSRPDEEYDEALAKAALLTELPPEFCLLETLLLEHSEYFLLERHLDRLGESAHYFTIPLSMNAARQALAEYEAGSGGGRHSVRLLVSPQGGIRVEGGPLKVPTGRQYVALSRRPVSREDRFLFHKTTHRAVYEAHRTRHEGVYDVLLWNEEGQLTEFTTGNLVVEVDGCLYTPPVSCGLLAGTFRGHLLEAGKIRERVLTPSDLERSRRIWLINSLRGWVPVHLVDRDFC